MPDMQQPQAETRLSLTALALPRGDEDYALGFECADPSLQIERWHETLPPGAELN